MGTPKMNNLADIRRIIRTIAALPVNPPLNIRFKMPKYEASGPPGRLGKHGWAYGGVGAEISTARIQLIRNL